MTLDVHRAWQAGDVSGIYVHVNRKRGGFPAQAHGTYPQSVDPFQKFRLQLRKERVGIDRAQGPKEGLLGDERGLLEDPAQADSDYNRGTRSAARFFTPW